MRLVRFVPVVLGFALWAGSAAADEYEPPEFVGEDIVLDSESLPEGWSVGDASEEGANAVVQVVSGHATAAGITDDEDLLITTASFKDAAGAEVVLTFVDFEVDPADVPAKIKADAGTKGWAYRELGTPGRILIATGPDAARDAAVEAQVRHAVAALTQLGAKKFGVQSFRTAGSLAASAIAIDAKAAAPHVVLGLAMLASAGTDKEKAKPALDELRKGLKADAPVPAEGQVALLGWTSLGSALLQIEKSPETDKEAREAFKKAIALEEFGKKDPVLVAGNHYNLGCAHARLGEKADAIREVEIGLKGLKEGDPSRWPGHLKHAKEADTDLDSIRGDAAFQEMIKKFEGSSAPSGA